MSASSLAARVRSGERRALAKAITLVESLRDADRELAIALLTELYPHSGRSQRLGITGPPGAGKSTLVDALGRAAISAGRKVGVLAIDPTSEVSGGSLLGDRTRMGALAGSADAFVRPSPSAGASGGMGRSTREALVLLEAAGYDVVIVETVGVGQGELAVTEAVDLVVVLAMAGAGDEVQGMKRGLLEHADVVVFTKADGHTKTQSLAARDELAALFAWMRSDAVPVLAASAFEPESVAAVWQSIETRFAERRASGELEARRALQRTAWFSAALEAALLERLRESATLDARRAAIEEQVHRGELLPSAAARALVRQV